MCLKGANSRFLERKLTGDIIAEHNKVFEKHRKVMFGRFEMLSVSWWNQLHNLFNASHARWGVKLMIVLRRGRNYQGFSTRCFKVGESWPNPRLVPEYYRDLIPDTHLWFEIGKFVPMNSKELSQYVEDIAYGIKRRRKIFRTLLNC